MSSQLPRHQRVAITGAAGQLGRELTSRLGSAALPLTRSALDLGNTSQIRDVLLQVKPDVVINAAAYTAVDRAETDRDACFQINATAVESLAQTCEELACPLVQISTDYVFGGDTARREPYAETSSPNPVNVYGQSKLAGEQAAATWRRHIIIRTCGLYSANPSGPQKGRNFADTMLLLGRERPVLRVVDDQLCTPTYVPHFAEMVLSLIAAEEYGLFHATNLGATTWFQFARELFAQAGSSVKLEPITTQEFGAPAPRPGFSVLKPSPILARLACAHPTWQAGIADYLDGSRGP